LLLLLLLLLLPPVLNLRSYTRSITPVSFQVETSLPQWQPVSTVNSTHVQHTRSQVTQPQSQTALVV
jgi:hypothetical protein